MLNNESRNNKIKYFTRGGQITFHNWRMFFQINKVMIKLYAISLILLTFAMVYLITPSDVFFAAYYWCYSKITIFLGFGKKVFKIPYEGSVYRLDAHTFLTLKPLIANAKSLLKYIIGSFFAAFVINLLITHFTVRWLTKRGKQQAESKYIRGARLEQAKVVAKEIFKNKQQSNIFIDDFPLTRDFEVRHTLIHGTTGTGKSQLIMKLLDQLLKRGDKVIIYDKGCTFVENYYREGKDIILNPFDSRCANWSLWREALEAPDFENMAESLIPMHGETDPFWVNAARTIFGSAAFTMQDDADRSITKLLQLLLTSELQTLAQYVEGTEAASLTNDKIEKTAISIRSILSTYLKSLRFLRGLDESIKDSTGKEITKPPFAIREWLNKKDNSWLFISSNAEQHSALRPLISMWLAMASISILSLEPNQQRRIWLIIDELPSLHKLPQLAETIAEVRKFGGCFVLGMQSHSQLAKVYGDKAAAGIFDLLNTRFFFRSPSADMAKIVSQSLGEQEIEDINEGYSYGANDIRDGVTIGQQRKTQPIVTYSQIMSMEDMQCYLRLAANYPVSLLALKLQTKAPIAINLIRRDVDSSLDSNLEECIAKTEGKAGHVAIKLNATNHDVVVPVPPSNNQNTEPLPAEKINKKIDKRKNKNTQLYLDI